MKREKSFLKISLLLIVPLLFFGCTKKEEEKIPVEEKITSSQKIVKIERRKLVGDVKIYFLNENDIVEKEIVPKMYETVEFKINEDREMPLLTMKGVQYIDKDRIIPHTFFNHSFAEIPEFTIELSTKDYNKYISD